MNKKEEKGLLAKFEKVKSELETAQDDKAVMEGQLVSIKYQATEMMDTILGSVKSFLMHNSQPDFKAAISDKSLDTEKQYRLSLDGLLNSVELGYKYLDELDPAGEEE